MLSRYAAFFLEGHLRAQADLASAVLDSIPVTEISLRLLAEAFRTTRPEASTAPGPSLISGCLALLFEAARRTKVSTDRVQRRDVEVRFGERQDGAWLPLSLEVLEELARRFEPETDGDTRTDATYLRRSLQPALVAEAASKTA